MTRVYTIGGALFLVMAIGTGNIIDRIVYGEWPGKSGDKITETLNILQIIISLLLFWWGARKAKISRFNRLLPLAVVSLLLCSVLWSVTPELTTTRGVAYFFAVVGTIGIVELFAADELMDLMGCVCAFSAVASVLLALVAPAYAFAWGLPGLRGIFVHKNMLGQVMVVGLLAGLHGLLIVDRPRFRYICLIALCTAVAFASKSETSIFIVLVYFGLWILTTLYIQGTFNRLISICLATVLVPVLILLVIYQDVLLDLLGKDPTLTGRTELWPYVIEMIYRKPVLGWGFQAFWSPSNPLVAEIERAVGWTIPESHNGLLELLLQLGIIGTLLFLFLLIRNLILAIKCMHGPAREVGASSLLFLINILILSVSESVLLTPDQFSTIQFFMMGFMCEKMLWLARYAQRKFVARPARLGSNLAAIPFASVDSSFPR